MAETTVTLVSKDGEHTQKIADTEVNRVEITRLRAAGWAEPKEQRAAAKAEAK